jgi:hypothetical protein
VLITVDQSIPDQQNLAGRTISVLILCAPTNRLRDLEPLVPAANLALDSIGPGQALRITSKTQSSYIGDTRVSRPCGHREGKRWPT